MSRRIDGTITELVPGKVREREIDFTRVSIDSRSGFRVTLRNTGASLEVSRLLRIGEEATLYVGGPFLFMPSQIFGVRTATAEAFNAPRAILYVPGALLVLVVAVPLAMLPVTLLLFPVLVLAAIWMILLSWSGMGARARFKRDGRRAARRAAQA